MLSKSSAFIIVHNEIQDELFIIINKLIIIMYNCGKK